MFVVLSVVAAMPLIMVKPNATKVRICEHLGISHLTGKKRFLQAGQSTTILEHTLFCRGTPFFF